MDHYLVAQRTALFRALDVIDLRHTLMAHDDSQAVSAFLDFVQTIGKYMYTPSLDCLLGTNMFGNPFHMSGTPVN